MNRAEFNNRIGGPGTGGVKWATSPSTPARHLGSGKENRRPGCPRRRPLRLTGRLSPRAVGCNCFDGAMHIGEELEGKTRHVLFVLIGHMRPLAWARVPLTGHVRQGTSIEPFH